MALLKLPRQAEKRNPIVGVIIGLVVAAVFGLLYNTWSKKAPVVAPVYDLVKNLEYRTYDRRFVFRGPLPKSDINPDIVLLDYDNDAEQWKPFPPDRTVYPDIIRALGSDGASAKAMFFDIFFFDPFGRRLDVNSLDLFYSRFSDLKGNIKQDLAVIDEEKIKVRTAFEAINDIADATTFQKAQAALAKAMEAGAVDTWDAALLVDAKKAVDSKLSLAAPGTDEARGLKALSGTLGELAYPPIIATVKAAIQGLASGNQDVFYDLDPGQIIIVKRQLEALAAHKEDLPGYVAAGADAGRALKPLNDVFTDDRVNNAYNFGGIFQPNDFEDVDFSAAAKTLDAVYPDDNLAHQVPPDQVGAALASLTAMYPESKIRPLLAPANVARANAALQSVLAASPAVDSAALFKDYQAFFEQEKSLDSIAFDMDEELRQAIKDAGNVYLAQIVEDKLVLPYGIDDVLFDRKIHGEFEKRIKMSDRTNTKNQLEVDINTLITNLMTGEYKKLLKAAESGTMNGRKVIPFSKDTIESVKGTIAQREQQTTLALDMNFRMGFDLSKKAPVSAKDLARTYRVLREIKPLNKHIVEFAQGYGYVKPELQKDGIIRMIAPVADFQDRFYPHIAFMLSLRYMGVKNEDVEFHRDSIVLKHAKLPGKKPRDITVPLIEGRSLLVNWAGSFTAPNQFEHRSFKAIYEIAHQYNLIRRSDYTAQYIPVKKADYLKKYALLEKSDYAMYAGIIETIDQYNALMDTYEVLAKRDGGEDLTPEESAKVEDLSAEDIEKLVNDINALAENLDEDSVNWYNSQTPEELQAIRDYMAQNGAMTGDEQKTLEAMTQAQIDEIMGFLQEHGAEITPEDKKILDSLSGDQQKRVLDYVDLYGAITPEQQQIVDALSPKQKKDIISQIEFFRDKVVLTGLTAPYTHDLNPIPFDPRYPLVGMHANLVNTLTMQLFISALPWHYFFLIILGLGLAVGFVGGRSKQLPGALITLGVILGYALVCVLAFNFARMWLPFVPVALALVFVYLIVVAYRFMTEGQEAKKMKAMFSTYVTPSVVEVLIQRPEMLKLGGERMDLTAMFALASGPGIHTDNAEILVDRLNEYFTAMTEEIFRYDGTLDKYEGHIIMAIYGAPVPYDDHPTRACLSCVGMKLALDKLKVEWAEKGLGAINATVGLNSGPMIAGNMGSASRFNYTIMGDSVNLSARILGAANQYGVSFMCSEMTYDRAKDQIIARLVDDIVVVGKTEPIKVYEILGSTENPPDAAMRACMDAYAQGFALYTERKWDEAVAAFRKALESVPDDGPSKTLIARCEEYKQTPPSDDWKGEFKLTKKGV